MSNPAYMRLVYQDKPFETGLSVCDEDNLFELVEARHSISVKEFPKTIFDPWNATHKPFTVIMEVNSLLPELYKFHFNCDQRFFDYVEIFWLHHDIKTAKDEFYFKHLLEPVKVFNINFIYPNIKDPEKERYNHLVEIDFRYRFITVLYPNGYRIAGKYEAKWWLSEFGDHGGMSQEKVERLLSGPALTDGAAEWLENYKKEQAEKATVGANKNEDVKFPLLIAESKNKPGFDRINSSAPAEDLTYGNYTVSDYKKINLLCHNDDNIAILEENRLLTVSDERLFEIFRDMATTFFSVGELKDNIIKMIDHFKENTGTDYRNDVLNRAVKQHHSMLEFVRNVNTAFNKKLSNNFVQGDLTMIYNLPYIHRPQFSDWLTDLWEGLKIAVNDTMAYKVELLSYSIDDSKNYSGKIKVTIFDDFGLDSEDIAEKLPGKHPGFRAWFILQHIRGYKPFITVMENEFDLSGAL
jgi:uncharacterized protein (TIGR03034 family)